MSPAPNPPLEDLHREIRGCRACALAAHRTHAVPGHGRPDADIMLVGEGPGYHEDQQGLPFVGAAGRFLDELLARAGIRREEVFVTNVVKCRPPGNRDPGPEEIAACSEYLLAQIALIKPRAIFTLGRFALATLIDEKLTSISRVHGQVYRKCGIIYVPLYHPAAALHNEGLREIIVQDMANAAAVLRRELAPAEPPRQLATPPRPPEQQGRLDLT